MNVAKAIKLGDLFDIQKGQQFTVNKQSKKESLEKIKILSYSDVKRLLNGDNLEYIDFKKSDLTKKYKNCYVHQGDIVVPTFPQKGKFEALYIGVSPKDKCIYSESNFILRLKKTELISAQYIQLILNSKEIGKKIETEYKGATQARITLKMLSGLEVPVVSIKEQQKIVKEYVEAIKRLNAVNEKMDEIIKGE